LALPGVSLALGRNEEVFGEGEPAEFVYKLLAGAVRTCRLISDGRRQVSAFHFPGDVFGMELGRTHRFTAEAIVSSRVALIRRTVLERAADRDETVARQLWALALHELEDLQDHALLLGHKTAVERVAAFLLKLARRAPSLALTLPMSRHDIADHLGLSLETVSRTLNQFAREDSIALAGARQVTLRDLTALTTATEGGAKCRSGRNSNVIPLSPVKLR
jgi:CRP/FNR family nitrogen fixation transcriptional regulator